ncbi:YcaO-like family protein [Micrococcales bacterium 31B]|nr:YcaO-like family protein [Micrococcales bacterium 31B]
MTSANTSNVVPFKHAFVVGENTALDTSVGGLSQVRVTVDAPPDLFAVFTETLDVHPEPQPLVGDPSRTSPSTSGRAHALPIAQWATDTTPRDPDLVDVHVLITRESPAPHFAALDAITGPRLLLWTTSVGVWSLAFGPGRNEDWHQFEVVVPRLQIRYGQPLTPEACEAALLRAVQATATELNRNPHCFGRLANLLAWHDETQTPHPVLPPPTSPRETDPLDDHRDDPRALAHNVSAAESALPLIDPYTGIITGVSTQLGPAGYPRHFAYTEFTLIAPFEVPGLTAESTPGMVAKIGELRQGLDPTSPTAESALRALGRYCSSIHTQGEIWHAPRRALLEAGENVVDLSRFDFVLTRTLAMAQRDPETPIWWIKGDYEGLPVWVPRDTVFRTFERGCVHPHIELSGLGSSLHHDDAAEMALRNVICQDALAVWWTRGGVADQLPTPASIQDAWVTESGAPCSVDLTLLDLRNTYDLPTVLAIVEKDNYVGYGCASHRDYETACELAATEALLHHHLQSEQRARAVTEAQSAAMRERVSDTTLATYPASPGLDARASLQRNGWEYIIVDLTTDDARACGCHVVRAVVPGLAAPTPGAVPSSPMARILRAAAYLGWENNPLRPNYYELF